MRAYSTEGYIVLSNEEAEELLNCCCCYYKECITCEIYKKQIELKELLANISTK